MYNFSFANYNFFLKLYNDLNYTLLVLKSFRILDY